MADIGDNSGDVSTAEQIVENLAEKHKAIKDRADALAATKDRLPTSVDNLEDANKLSTFIRQCMTLEKEAEALRVQETEPYLAGQRAVMGFFRSTAGAVKAAKEKAQEARTAYDVAVDNRERERLKEEARVAKEKADALAKEAATTEERAQAEVKQVQAEEAHQATRVKSAELTRTHTTDGVVSSLKTEWRHEVTEAKKVPRKYCQPDDKLLRAAVKSAVTKDGACPLEIAGVRIYEHKFTQTR